MKTIVLTGATGYLGSCLLKELVILGYNVVILKRSTSNTWRIKSVLNNIKFYDVDCESIEKAFTDQSIDYVIHTACHYGRNGCAASEVVDSNLMFGLKVLDACVKYKIKAFFNADTFLTNNINIYARSKKQFCEWLFLVSDRIQIINLRIEHIYGPGNNNSNFVSWLLLQLNENIPEIKLTQGDQQRDFIYIDDVVSAFLLVLKKSETLPMFIEFDVVTGFLITIKGFVQKLKEIYEISEGPVQTNFSFGAIPYREGEVMKIVANNLDLINLGWDPKFSLDYGLKKTIEDGR
jgi:CDP-paratose synthetase